MQRGTSIEQVQAVRAIDDPVLRNYWVTQTYADLASGLSTILDPDTANWCSFAVWASSTVGRNLRGEDLPDWLHKRVDRSDGMMGTAQTVNNALQQEHLDRGLHQILPEHLIDFVRELFGACATNLSEGNTEVFAEIAPAAATLLASLGEIPTTLQRFGPRRSEHARVHRSSKVAIAYRRALGSGAMH